MLALSLVLCAQQALQMDALEQAFREGHQAAQPAPEVVVPPRPANDTTGGPHIN